MSKVLRWCLDLNVWCAAFLADIKGTQHSSCQTLVKIVREGNCDLGKVELVISLGMLNRLQSVFIRLGVLTEDAFAHIEVIQSYANLSPILTLGGTGIIPLEDEEDRHVLETALAGKADLLITANFKDFLTKETEILILNQHYIYGLPDRKLHIVHPYLMMDWLRQGYIP